MSEVPSTGPEGSDIRSADLLGAFSLASDLATGLHTEHGARSCYIGMHIAQEMELPLNQRTDLYYAELLKDAGCTTYTSQLASSWLVDELTAKRDLQFFRDPRNPLDVASWLTAAVRRCPRGFPLSASKPTFVPQCPVFARLLPLHPGKRTRC